MSLGGSKVLGQPGHQQQQMTLGNPGSLTSANVLGQPRQLDILVDPALPRQSRHCMRLTHFDQYLLLTFAQFNVHFCRQMGLSQILMFNWLLFMLFWRPFTEFFNVQIILQVPIFDKTRKLAFEQIKLCASQDWVSMIFFPHSAWILKFIQ